MHIVRSIWTKPRAALREVINNNSFLLPFLILYLGSVGSGMFTLIDSQGMDFSSDFTTDVPMDTFEIPLWISFIGVLVLSPIFYFIAATIYTFFTMLFGKWLFKGTGKYKDLLKVNATSYLPFAFAIPVLGIWLLVSPDSLVDTQNTGIAGSILIFLLGMFTIIYYFIFNLVGISEAHQISKWKAFFTMMVPTIFFFIIIFVIFALLFLILFALFVV